VRIISTLSGIVALGICLLDTSVLLSFLLGTLGGVPGGHRTSILANFEWT